jgi:ankyrin repeat protein
MAAKHGDVQALKALLEHGVEVNVADVDGQTPWQVF